MQLRCVVFTIWVYSQTHLLEPRCCLHICSAKVKPFSLGIGLLLVHVPKALLCVISSSAICPQRILLFPPSFAVSLLWDPQCDHTLHYPVCFLFLTASHRKLSHEGGFVKRPSSLRVASDLFPFFSSCHSALLLSLSCLLNLICIFPQLLDWRYLQSSCSAYSKGESSILLPSFKSNSSVYNVLFPFKSLLPLQFEVGLSFLSPALDPGTWRELTLLSPSPQPPKSSVSWSGKFIFSILVKSSKCL